MDDEPAGLRAAITERLGWIIGVVGLAAWLVMLWLMFGDVL